MPTFTRRHYTAIADAFSQDRPTQGDLFAERAFTAVVDRLVAVFADDNPAFHADRFRAACFGRPFVR